MEATAEKGVVHIDEDVSLQEGVKGNLKTMGQPADVVPPIQKPVLSGKLGLPEPIDLVPESVERVIFGEEPLTFAKTASGSRLRNWIIEKAQRIRNSRQKKAA